MRHNDKLYVSHFSLKFYICLEVFFSFLLSDNLYKTRRLFLSL